MKNALFLLCLLACGLLALSGSASASEAVMVSPQQVEFRSDRHFRQNHSLTIARDPAAPARLVVKDRGGAITGHWRFWTTGAA